MKTEKTTTTTGAEALKKVNEVLQRIEAKKAELKKELAKTEAELEARQTGATKAGSFDLESILNNDNNETTEKLKVKISKIKAALALPNYADADFRKYSIIYLEAAVEEHTAERAAINKEIAKLETELYNLPHTIREKEKERAVILDAFYKKTREIGVEAEFTGLRLQGADSLLRDYKELCETYND